MSLGDLLAIVVIALKPRAKTWGCLIGWHDYRETGGRKQATQATGFRKQATQVTGFRWEWTTSTVLQCDCGKIKIVPKGD
jgi:hypothetical protein